MTVDEASKLILVIAISFSLLLISFGIFKILNNLGNVVNDFRSIVGNLNKLSEMSLEDYGSLRKHFLGVSTILSQLYKNLGEPLVLVKNFMKSINKIKKEDSSK